MRVGITGSRYGHPELLRWLAAWVARRGVPELFVFGDNEDCEQSVDLQAYIWARERGYPLLRCRKDPAHGSLRFKRRNQLMVDVARVDGPGEAVFFAFPCPKSRGTYDCANRCKEAGVHVFWNRSLTR